MIQEPRCFTRRCKHFQGVEELGEGEETQVCVCAAFPKGIPDVIAFGDNLHLTPFPGDNGIQYEPVDEEK